MATFKRNTSGAVIAIAAVAVTAVAAPAHMQLKPVTVAASPPARKAEFRLSNFEEEFATVCVKTDMETQCTGRVPVGAGTSRVYTVRYRKLTGWTCHVKSGNPPHSVHSHKFSRRVFKECLWFDRSIYGKRPDGSQKNITN